MGARGPLPQTPKPVIFPPGVPEPSDRLDESAKIEYVRAADLCKQAGRELQQTDMAILECYAQAFSDYWRMDAQIKVEGDMNGGRLHPLMRSKDNAWKQLAAAAAKLGFSPADRPRLGSKGNHTPTGPDPLSGF